MTSSELSRDIPFNDGWTVQRSRDIVSEILITDGGPDVATVRLPHDAALDDRSPTAGSGPMTGFHNTGAFTYTKSFVVPEGWADKVVIVEFEGVYRDAQVFINNAFAAYHPYGYTGFAVPLDSLLEYGATNVIRVETRSHLDARWYSGAGIYRPVTLHVLDPVHIPLNGVVIATSDVAADLATVEVTTAVTNTTRHTRTVRLLTTLATLDGDVAGEDSSPVTVLPGQVVHHRNRIVVENPKLWSVDDPALYVATSTIVAGEVVSDEIRTTFGIRSLTLDAKRGLRINGEVVKLRGAAIHHDNGPIGAATVGRADERRIELLKAAGFNAVRMAHNPASRALLDACDRHGVLVMNEAFDVWNRGKSDFDYARDFSTHWQSDITAMVESSRNHPSVILYSIGNEIMEIVDRHGANLGRQLSEFTRSLDPTRFVTNALQLMWLVMEVLGSESVAAMNALMSSGEADAGLSTDQVNAITARIEEYASTLDVVGFNYADYRYEIAEDQFPHQVVVGSETFPARIATYWRLVEKYPHVIGDFTWVGWDYLGEVGIGSTAYADESGASGVFMREYPYLSAESGDLDITGFRRPISFYREIVFGLRSDPYIAVQHPVHFGKEIAYRTPFGFTDAVSTWTFEESFAGAPIRVEVYADADEVVLQLDGSEIGRSATGAHLPHVAVIETTWHPGEITAIAYEAGVETGRFTVASAQGAIHLSATADYDEIGTDDDALAYLTIELRDERGVVTTADDREVTVVVRGPATLAGFGTGNPVTDEKFGSPTRTTFRGRALAVVRPAGAGQIDVVVSSPGLEDAIVSLKSRALGSSAAGYVATGADSDSGT